ncbi:MAG: hypothetical protein QOD51_2214, partial [Candidatus Eremiobacteraeota bacterium]|nr:hypothetical protein [Candidatus Eremiobacteraeota bacterium]
TTFREARRTAREMGFPVTVRPWSAMPSQAVVISDLGALAQHVERNHIAITREMPLLVERIALPVRTKRTRIETGTYEPANREPAAAVEARSA